MYTSLAILTTYYPQAVIAQLTDDVHGSVVDDDVLVAVIASVDEDVDALLRGRYPVPLVPVPRVIERLASNLVWYRLHKRRNTTVPDGVTKDYDDAMTMLRALQTGRALLPQSNAGHTTPRFVVSNKEPEDRTFSSDVLRRY